MNLPQTRSNRFHTRSAFTLIEILTVTIIIGMLVSTLLLGLRGATTSAKNNTAKVTIDSTFGMALRRYELENGNFPTSEQGLKALVEKPSSDPAPKSWTQYLEQLPKDPWNQDYVYVCPGTHNPDTYDLLSKGANKTEGDDDDIANWKK